MAATPPKKTIVNPTLVGVDAGGAAGVSLKSGKGPVETDGFRVSSNLDARVPRRTRLPRLAAGDDFIAPVPADATDALVLQDAKPKRHRAGPSSRKRKQARAANEVSAAINNDKSVNEVVNAAPDNDGGANLLTPEVSNDEGGVEEDDDSRAESVTPQLNPKPQPLASTKGETGSYDGSYDNNDDDMEALGSLNRDPHLVGSIFARRAADERLAGLNVAANVWNTTKQLLGDSSAAQKLAWAMAASKERAYLVVMGGNKYFTLIHHLTIMDVELCPKDPIKGQLVAFEAEMRDDGAPPAGGIRWARQGPFPAAPPPIRLSTHGQHHLHPGGPSDKRFLGVRAPSDPPADWPAVTTRLIPIPMAWAAYFLDKPDFGVAVRRLDTLVESVSRLEQVQFAPTIDSLLLGCYGDRQDKKSAYSALSLDWDPLPLHPKTKAWMQDRWSRFTSNKAGNSSDALDGLPHLEDERKMPARRSI
jgi:hypothetical protein